MKRKFMLEDSIFEQIDFKEKYKKKDKQKKKCIYFSPKNSFKHLTSVNFFHVTWKWRWSVL